MDSTRFPSPSEAALAYVNTYNSHDPEALRSLYDPGFLVENPLWEGTKDVDETVATIQMVWDTLPGARFEAINLIVQGDTVSLELNFCWDEPTEGGSTVRRLPVNDVFWIKDGKLAGLRAYLDRGTFVSWLQQMGSDYGTG